jgi:uncharacterized protein YfiM (DUF2279 family)
MTYRFVVIIILIFLSRIASAQLDTARSYSPLKFGLVSGTGAVFYGGTLASLSTVWYQDKRPTGFHITNDNADWKQIDKWGHMYTCYAMGKMGMQSLRWAGVKDKRAVIYGGSFGILFMTSVEILDGHYEEWGASPMDMVANASGGILLIGQELAWKKQIVTMKFSYHHTELAELRPGVLGETSMGRIVEDYNGQTFWFSTNLKSIFKNSSFLPDWLNVAPGYGAYGMLSSRERDIYGKNGELLPNDNHTRHYYLSLDIDLDKVKTKSKFLKSVFFFLNMVKIPMPTFEVNNEGETKFHILYF